MKKNKFKLSLLTLFIIGSSTIYLSFAFAGWEVNPKMWTDYKRIGFALLEFLFIWIIIVNYTLHKHD